MSSVPDVAGRDISNTANTACERCGEQRWVHLRHDPYGCIALLMHQRDQARRALRLARHQEPR